MGPVRPEGSWPRVRVGGAVGDTRAGPAAPARVSGSPVSGSRSRPRGGPRRDRRRGRSRPDADRTGLATGEVREGWWGAGVSVADAVLPGGTGAGRSRYAAPCLPVPAGWQQNESGDWLALRPHDL